MPAVPLRRALGVAGTLTIAFVLFFWSAVEAVVLTPILLVWGKGRLYHVLDDWFWSRATGVTVALLEACLDEGVVVYGDDMSADNSLIVSNHISDCDSVLLSHLNHRSGSHGRSLRYMSKASVRYLAPIGPLMAFHDCIFLERSYDKDKHTISQKTELFAADRNRLWLLLFPEGTFTSPLRGDLIQASHDFADAHGLPRLQNMLVPRVKGVQSLLRSSLRDKFADVYVLTTAFSGCFDTRLGRVHPMSFLSLVMGRAGEVNSWDDPEHPLPGPRGEKSAFHIHVSRVPVADVPQSEEGIAEWLLAQAQKQDERLEFFREHRRFPGTAQRDTISLPRWVYLVLTALVPPIVVTYAFVKLWIAWMGGWIAAAPSIMAALAVAALGVGGIVGFLIMQGRKKGAAKEAAKDAATSSSSKKKHA